MSACKADTSIERKKGDGPPGLNRLLRTDTIHLAALWELGLAAHIQGSLFCCFVLFCFFLAMLGACRSSWAREQTRATAVTLPDP